jgi:transcriptional regulator with XRE-family HTH domain
MRKDFDESALRMRITKTRESKGLNQAQLAEKAGITPAAVSQIEKGNRVPSIPVLHRIAGVLEVSIDYLMGKTDKSEIEDLLQSGDIKTFFRGFASLSTEDKEVIKKHIDFLKSQNKG